MLTSLAFLAPVVLFWKQAQSFIVFCFSFFVRTDKISYAGGRAFIPFLAERSKFITFGNVFYSSDTVFVKSKKSWLPCFRVLRGKYVFLYKNKYPIIITVAEGNYKILYFNVFNFHKLLGEFNKYWHEEILEKRKDEENFFVDRFNGDGNQKQSTGQPISGIDKPNSPNNNTETYIHNFTLKNFNIAPIIGFKKNELTDFTHDTLQNSYYLTHEGKYLLNQLEKWKNAKDWYEKRQIPYRRGCLLHGIPGTGKSAMVLEIAKRSNMGISIFDLSGMDNKKFYDCVKMIPYKSIVLFEDIDNIFDGRTNLTKNENFQGVTFDCFLNQLSGVKAIQNAFIFITTNHIEKLDPALLRDGRIDEKVELGYLPQEGKTFIANKILDNWPELIPSVITKKDETVAEFQNRCVKLALDQYWGKKI